MTKAIVEKLCRAICERRGLDPDVKIGLGIPQFINQLPMIAGYFIPHEDHQHPMWEAFQTEAIAVLDALLEPSSETMVEYYTASDTLLSIKGWRAAMLHMRRTDK